MFRRVATRLRAFVAPPAAAEPVPSLHATVAYHCAHIVLHGAPSPQTVPSRYSTELSRALQLKTTPWRGLVNFASDSVSNPSSEDRCALTVFSALNGSLHVPQLTMDNLDEVAEQLHRHATVPTALKVDEKLYIYVCTHTARDCRCGETGGAVYRAMRAELDARQTANVVLGEVTHVGQHQFAANVLVFPHGEWFGRVTVDAVPSLLDTLLASPRRPLAPSEPALYPSLWRGRMGLNKEQQTQLAPPSA
ncbi:hypothetical protein MKEN_00508100 [Mycena kentingensis (nom. inval.)]|nr:hypothetical protein MKEN_00508100 [Mycena kentingensis (nom. inval.)]